MLFYRLGVTLEKKKLSLEQARVSADPMVRNQVATIKTAR